MRNYDYSKVICQISGEKSLYGIKWLQTEKNHWWPMKASSSETILYMIKEEKLHKKLNLIRDPCEYIT